MPCSHGVCVMSRRAACLCPARAATVAALMASADPLADLDGVGLELLADCDKEEGHEARGPAAAGQTWRSQAPNQPSPLASFCAAVVAAAGDESEAPRTPVYYVTPTLGVVPAVEVESVA